MPKRPSKACTNCSKGIVRDGVYSKCGPKPKGWKSDKERGTRQQRGYGEDWQRLRKAKLAANPLCEEHKKDGVPQSATEVHHTVPFNGINDPLRLDWNNLQSVCAECHRKKTARRGR